MMRNAEDIIVDCMNATRYEVMGEYFSPSKITVTSIKFRPAFVENLRRDNLVWWGVTDKGLVVNYGAVFKMRTIEFRDDAIVYIFAVDYNGHAAGELHIVSYLATTEIMADIRTTR